MNTNPSNEFVNTAQVEQNTSAGGGDNIQDDSTKQQPIRLIKSKFEQLAQQNTSVDIKSSGNSQLQKFKNVVNVVNAAHAINNSRKTPPPIPPKSKIGGIKPIIPPSSLALKNNLSPTLLQLPHSAPPPLAAGYISADDNPFDDSKEIDPFADYNETNNEPQKMAFAPRPRRHSHTHVTSKIIGNVYDNANSNLNRSSSQSVTSKPLRKSDNSSSDFTCDSQNKPSLPPRPQKPPLPDRPQRNLDTDHHNDNNHNNDNHPDAACANRRPPKFRGIKDINSKVTTRTFAIAGDFVITGSGHTRVWSLDDGINPRSISHDDSKVTSLCWRPTRRVEDVGRYIWCGAQDGSLFAVDINGEKHIESNKKAHNSQVNFILRHEFQLWTLDDSGKLQIWSESEDGIISLKSKPPNVKVSPKANCAIVVGHHLWLSSGRTIEIFNPLDVSGLEVETIELAIDIGNVKNMTQTNNPSLVYIGHDDGKITVWNVQTYKLELIMDASVYCINSLLGVGDYLWVGFKTGMIYIYDVRSNPWIVIKDWQAHKAPIVDMQLDGAGLWRVERLQVASLSGEGQIIVWDGLMYEDWIADRMVARENKYCKFREVKVLICSWNIDASKPADLEKSGSVDDIQFLRSWFKSTESPDIIFVGFQEIIDLESKKMTAKTMLMSKKKADKQLNENITQRYKLWYDKLITMIQRYTDQEYEVVLNDNLVGLFTCIFAKKSELDCIRDTDVAIKKTGLGGRHGNKGSIATRFIYDDSSICFVNCHLAAGQAQVSARNTDVANILDNTTFPSRANSSFNDNEGVFTHGGDGSMVLDHEIVFVSGDLNYRIDLPREKVIKAIESKDYSLLLEHDQLLKQRDTNPGFRLRSFLEGTPKFAPTYKYDRGNSEYDTSEKKRTPAWCDRILYFGTNIKQEHYLRYECKVSDHRPISGAFKIRIKTIKTNRQDEVKEEVKRAWIEKVKGEKRVIMVKWIKSCGWDEESASRALEENYDNLRKAIDVLSKKDGSGGGGKRK